MSMNLMPEKFSCEPEYLLAGTDICVTTAIKAAAADLKAGAPVKLDASGKVAPVTSAEDTGLYGITTEGFRSGEDAVIYLTGEFFADRLALEKGVTADKLEVAFRNIGIFLK